MYYNQVMQSLLECVQKAEKNHRAVGHFNVSTLDMLWAVVATAKSLSVPVIIGASEGERDFMGALQLRDLVHSIREQYNLPLYLNADHTYSFERAEQVIDLGYDSVVVDGAKLPWDENVALTKRVAEYAASKHSNIVVEGELGYIGQSSKILDAIPDGANINEESLTTIEQAKEFIEKTGIKMFAPAIGSIHGMMRTGSDPDLNIQRIKDIHDAVDAPLVLHGGSGLTQENFKKGIAAGISVVHVSTELRAAWTKAVKLSLQENPDEIAPYKILKSAQVAVQKVVEEKLRLYNNM